VFATRRVDYSRVSGGWHRRRKASSDDLLWETVWDKHQWHTEKTYRVPDKLGFVNRSSAKFRALPHQRSSKPRIGSTWVSSHIIKNWA
jgi:hypothetical protein